MSDPGIIYKVLRRRQRLKKEISAKPFDSSAMADIAFLLLIFFIVTSSFIIKQGLFFSLPSPRAGKARIDESRVLEIYPQREGFIYEGKSINREKLVSLFREHAEKVTESVVVIKMAQDVTYDRFIDALSVARECNIYGVSIKNIQ